MPKADLTKTHELADILFVPRDQRDRDWVRQFYAVVGDAAMTTTADQILQGPDGFSYFVLNMPAPNRDFQPLSLAQVLDFCLENSLGVVVEPQPEPPERVIPFGQLWSKKELGKFDLSLEPDPESETAREVRSPDVPSHLAGKPAVLVGQPNQYYFPAFARSAVRKFLLSQGYAVPGVLLLSHPNQSPLETIIFSVFPEDFAEQNDFSNFMQHLAWFFPPHYQLSSISKTSELAKNFQPL